MSTNNRNESLAQVLQTLNDVSFSLQNIANSIAASGITDNVPETEKIQVSKDRPTEDQVYKRTTEILKEFGVPASIKGHAYIRYAVVFAYFNPPGLSGTTKVLYPKIAEKFGTTNSRVERAIRHAIEVSFDRGNLDVLQKHFGYSISAEKAKATNSEFIASIVDKLQIEFNDYIM